LTQPYDEVLIVVQEVTNDRIILGIHDYEACRSSPAQKASSQATVILIKDSCWELGGSQSAP